MSQGWRSGLGLGCGSGGQWASRWYLKIGEGQQGSGKDGEEEWTGVPGRHPVPGQGQERPRKRPPRMWEGNQMSEVSWAKGMEKSLGLCAEGPDKGSPGGRSQGTCTRVLAGWQWGWGTLPGGLPALLHGS